MLETKVWEKSEKLYNFPVKFDSLACANNILLLHFDPYPQQENNFDIILRSENFESWYCFPMSPVYDNPISNLEIYGYDNKIFLAGTMVIDGEKRFIVLNSTDGINYIQLYMSDDASENYVPNKINSYQGVLFVLCTGCFYLGTNNSWNRYDLPEELKDYQILDNCYFKDSFYFLCSKNNVDKIVVFDSDFNLQSIINLDNSKGKFYSIEASESQILTVGSGSKSADVIIGFSNDSLTFNYVSKPITNSYNEKTVSTLYDIVYTGSYWVTVGGVETLIDGTPNRIPNYSLCFVLENNFNEASILNSELVDLDLAKKIYQYNNYLYIIPGATHSSIYVCRRSV